MGKVNKASFMMKSSNGKICHPCFASWMESDFERPAQQSAIQIVIDIKQVSFIAYHKDDDLYRLICVFVVCISHQRAFM